MSVSRHFSPPEDGFSNPSGQGRLENPPSDTAQLITIGEKYGLGASSNCRQSWAVACENKLAERDEPAG